MNEMLTAESFRALAPLLVLSAGTVIMMPDPSEAKFHLIDAEVASYFFHTEHYYAATIQFIQQTADLCVDVAHTGVVATYQALGQPIVQWTFLWHTTIDAQLAEIVNRDSGRILRNEIVLW